MNEQIREFEKQCWSHYVNGVLIDGHLHFDAQKFAELIVKECSGIVQNYMSRWPEDHELTKQIKEHFGVKE